MLLFLALRGLPAQPASWGAPPAGTGAKVGFLAGAQPPLTSPEGREALLALPAAVLPVLARGAGQVVAMSALCSRGADLDLCCCCCCSALLRCAAACARCRSAAGRSCCSSISAPAMQQGFCNSALHLLEAYSSSF